MLVVALGALVPSLGPPSSSALVSVSALVAGRGLLCSSAFAAGVVALGAALASPPADPGAAGRRRVSNGALEALMDRYATGDDTAFAALYDGLSPPLYGFLVRLTRDQSFAEDLVHETFLRIHRARGAYRPSAPVLPWSFAIARRLFLDDIRRFKRERLAVQRDDDRKSDPGIPTPEASAEEIAQARALEAVIETELAKLPESQATAFRLLKQEELSISEAAAILGATETTVKLRAHRAYVALRKVVASRWDPELLGGEP
jgi:RNA polymerase sigma-70 factor, ECF subfamily